MEKYKIELFGVSETLLIPVYARALESRKENHEFFDAIAIKIVDSVEYDFDKFYENKMNLWGCAARTIIIDNQVSEFIKDHPNCSIINMACGFDSRFNRVDNGKITWYNIDFPSVMNIRKDLIPEQDRVIELSGSVLDDFWYEKIENKNDVLIVAEGVLMYFEENEVKALFDKVAEKFENCTLMCELMSKWMAENKELNDVIKKTTVSYKWGVEKTEDFIKLCPEYKMIGEYNFTDEMKRFAPALIEEIAPKLRDKNNRLGCFEKI